MIDNVFLRRRPKESPQPFRYPASVKKADYHFSVDLEPLTGQQRTLHLPVSKRMNPDDGSIRKEVWSAEIAGLRIEAGNLAGLKDRIRHILIALVNFSRLPGYVLIPTRGAAYLPVYARHGEVIAVDHGGPTFRSRDLALLRRYATDYFRALGTLGETESLEIMAVSPYDMTTQWPTFVIEGIEEHELWAPVFPFENGETIELHVHLADRHFTVYQNGGDELLDLHRAVTEYLMERGVLRDPYGLRFSQLSRATWKRLSDQLLPSRSSFSYPVSLEGHLRYQAVEVRRNSRLSVAAFASSRDLVHVYFGHDILDLRGRMSEDLYHRGIISSPDAVRTVSAQREEPISMLDRLLRTPAYSIRNTQYAIRST